MNEARNEGVNFAAVPIKTVYQNHYYDVADKVDGLHFIIPISEADQISRG